MPGFQEDYKVPPSRYSNDEMEQSVVPQDDLQASTNSRTSQKNKKVALRDGRPSGFFTAQPGKKSRKKSKGSSINVSGTIPKMIATPSNPNYNEVHRLSNLLVEAQRENAVLKDENRTLIRIQKRQEKAIQKMRSETEAYPQIVETVHDDLRVLRTKLRGYQDKLATSEKSLREIHVEYVKQKEKAEKLNRILRSKSSDDLSNYRHRVYVLEELVREKDEKLRELHEERRGDRQEDLKATIQDLEALVLVLKSDNQELYERLQAGNAPLISSTRSNRKGSKEARSHLQQKSRDISEQGDNDVTEETSESAPGDSRPVHKPQKTHKDMADHHKISTATPKKATTVPTRTAEGPQQVMSSLKPTVVRPSIRLPQSSPANVEDAPSQLPLAIEILPQKSVLRPNFKPDLNQQQAQTPVVAPAGQPNPEYSTTTTAPTVSSTAPSNLKPNLFKPNNDAAPIVAYQNELPESPPAIETTNAAKPDMTSASLSTPTSASTAPATAADAAPSSPKKAGLGFLGFGKAPPESTASPPAHKLDFLGKPVEPSTADAPIHKLDFLGGAVKTSQKDLNGAAYVPSFGSKSDHRAKVRVIPNSQNE